MNVDLLDNYSPPERMQVRENDFTITLDEEAYKEFENNRKGNKSGLASKTPEARENLRNKIFEKREKNELLKLQKEEEYKLSLLSPKHRELREENKRRVEEARRVNDECGVSYTNGMSLDAPLHSLELDGVSETIQNILDTPEGYDPFSLGFPPLSEREKFLYLLFFIKQTEWKNYIVISEMSKYGYKPEDLKTLVDRKLFFIGKTGKKFMIFHPYEVSENHPDIVDARRNKEIEMRSKAYQTLSTLKDLIDYVGEKEFLNAMYEVCGVSKQQIINRKAYLRKKAGTLQGKAFHSEVY